MNVEELKNEILEYHIGKRRLVYVDKIYHLRTSISKSYEFTQTELYKKIFEFTSFLPKDTTLFLRMKAILQGVTKLEYCPICKTNPKKICGDYRLDFPFFINTCGSTRCVQTKMISCKGEMTDKTKDLHKDAEKQHKTKLLTIYNDMLKRYADNDFTKIGYEDVTKFFKDKAEKQNYLGRVVRENDYIDHLDYLLNLLKYTSFIAVPQTTDSVSKIKFNERAYCIINHITEQPMCKFCKVEPVKFLSLKKGYVESCPNCVGDKWRAHIGCPTLEEMRNSIDTSKYEIISFPKHTGTEKLVIKCKKCGSISEYWISDGRGRNLGSMRLCKACEKYMSNAECEIRELIMQCTSEIKCNDRELIAPYEIDILIEHKNLAIEYDGFYYHNEKAVWKNYHLNKTELCEKQNFQLIHIFENEWLYKQDIVKSRLKNLLGIYDATVFARKCEIREVTSKESKIFQEANHIQGACNSSVNLGLYFNNELISLMTFGKCRFNKNYEWELLRFCNKLGYHVPGAAGKLLKHFEKTYNPTSLISYADRRWSRGKLYDALGFTLDHISRPNYWYYKNGDYELKSRVNFQKHKLKDKLEKFDPKLSESENMKNNGYLKIYDCGNLVYVKTY